MLIKNYLVFVACLLSLFIVTSVSAQDKKLSDAKTFEDVAAYIKQESEKIPADATQDVRSLAVADFLMAAGDKLLTIAQNDLEKRSAYGWKLQAHQQRVYARVADAAQIRDNYISGLASHEDPVARNFVLPYQFNQFRQRVDEAEVSPENFGKFMSELKTWINQKDLSASYITTFGLQMADQYKVPTEQFIKEMVEYVQSAECPLSAEEKNERIVAFEGVLRLTTLGNDPKLYGKTLDNKDFKWADLRKKYVLIKFTATWCGPCQRKIPGMLEAYEKYHEKGLEIVSIYMGQREADPVATVKNYVEEKKLPWIIISEELSKRAKHPEFGTYYGIRGVPTFVLVDPEGKIILKAHHGEEWKDKLAEIFK
jgi:thiol-disulfide isomerase/thioredoxin